MRVEWRPLARADLEDIVRFIAHDSPKAAHEMYDQIGSHVANLAEYPRIGRQGRVRGTRELVVVRTPFIVAYRVTKDGITILRVMHGARRWPQRF